MKYDTKYGSLNVLSQKTVKDYMSDDCIQDVANLLKAKGGNRNQRRRLEKSLGKVETVISHAQKKVDDSAYREYQKAVDKNYVHFFSCLALTMIEDYGWKETEDNEHGQITSLLERVDKKIKKYAELGYTTEDLVNKVEDITGLLLVPDKH